MIQPLLCSGTALRHPRAFSSFADRRIGHSSQPFCRYIPFVQPFFRNAPTLLTRRCMPAAQIPRRPKRAQTFRSDTLQRPKQNTDHAPRLRRRTRNILYPICRELSHILFSRKYKTLKPLPPYGPVSGKSYSVTIQNTGYGKADSPVLFQRRDFTHSSRFFISAVGSKRATTFPSRSTTNFVKFHLMFGLFL